MAWHRAEVAAFVLAFFFFFNTDVAFGDGYMDTSIYAIRYFGGRRLCRLMLLSVDDELMVFVSPYPTMPALGLIYIRFREVITSLYFL